MNRKSLLLIVAGILAVFTLGCCFLALLGSLFDTAAPEIQRLSTLTATPLPTDTPTVTPLPTDTPLSPPTDTSLPLPTDTPIPAPTDTPLPLPTDTPLPLPTDTPLPLPTDTPLPPEPPTAAPPAPAPSGACPQGCEAQQPGCDIKGNINREDEKIYHLPGGRDYDETKIDPTKGERWFCTPQEAEANGWRASKS